MESTRKVKRRLLKQQIDALNLIYRLSNTTCKYWGVTQIPLNTLKKICDKCKVNPDTTIQLAKDLATNFNKMVDSVYNAAISDCKKFKTEQLPLDILKTYIEVVVDELKKSFKG